MKKKILFVSLGCDKNLVDSEMMLGMLAEHGYEFTDDEQEADLVVLKKAAMLGTLAFSHGLFHFLLDFALQG